MSRVQKMSIRKDDSRRMEEEAKQMEAKLELLRRTMDSVESSAPRGADGGRWKSGSASKPLTKGYVKSVMEAPRPKMRPGGSQQRTPSGAGSQTPGEATPKGNSARGQGPNFSELLNAPLLPNGSTSASGGSRAASNLQAALTSQNSEQAEVEAFLGNLKLDRYVGLFMEHGFDCMEVVEEMEEHHMTNLGMAAGHVLKLRKKLAEMKPQPAPPPPAPPADNSSTQKRVSFGGAQVEPVITEAPAARKAVSSTGSAKLSEGAFDEDESAASFQEALMAWRNGGKTTTETQQPAAVASTSSPKAGPGSFWSSMAGGELNLERCSTPLKPPSELATTETQASATHNPAPGDDKLCCYQCYRQFFAQYAVERQSPLPEANGGGVKRLCSEACAEAWVKAMEVKAEAYRERQEKLEKMKAMQQALDASGLESQ
eukprot:TRINITY_DN9983_c0_g2_i1.p1 TRINITY_DN9983_c0_g2~~TRINITY_DN9983_c0_g2_i1.p1  ORF type:complete len:429 (+),score=123.08 TRINITY_DN9983_c0_g2_i1:96-1382(+)